MPGRLRRLQRTRSLRFCPTNRCDRDVGLAESGYDQLSLRDTRADHLTSFSAVCQAANRVAVRLCHPFADSLLPSSLLFSLGHLLSANGIFLLLIFDGRLRLFLRRLLVFRFWRFVAHEPNAKV